MTTWERAKARTEIIQACNRRKIERVHRRHWLALATRSKVHPETTLFGSRHIEQAVCMARRFRLVSDEVLVAGGYRPVGS